MCLCICVSICAYVFICVLAWKYDGKGISIHPGVGNGLKPGAKINEKRVT